MKGRLIMKKKFLVSLLTLAASISLAACKTNPSTSGTTETPSASTPASDKEELKLNKLQIANKDAFQGFVYAGDDDIRLDLSVDEGRNATALVNSKDIKVTSSNTKVASVVGLGVFPIGVGEVTITVSGGGKSDSVSFYVGNKTGLVPEDTEVGVKQERKIAVDSEKNSTKVTDYDWTSSDTTIATIKDGVVTGVKEGNVVIKAVLKSNAKEGASISIKVATTVSQPVNINTITKATSGDVTVRGEIIVKAPGYFFIADETAAIEVYTATDYKVGDVVKVTGAVKSYYGVLEFKDNLTIVKVGYKVTSPFGKEPTELTADMATSLANAPSDGSKSKDYRKIYKWFATATKKGNFTCFNIDGCSVPLEPANETDFTITTGNYYDVEGIWINGSSKYVQFYRTKITEAVPPKTIVRTSASALTVDVGNTRQLSATYILSKADADKNVNSVTWESADPTIATVSESGLVTAVKEGSVKIKAIVGETTAEVAVTIVPAHEVKKINQLSVAGEAVRVKAVVTSVSKEGAILSDETGNIYAEYATKKGTVAPSLKANDFVEVIANLSVYKGITSFFKLTAEQVFVFDATATDKPTVPARKAEALTKEIANGFVQEKPADQNASANPTTVDKVKLYTWTTTITTDSRKNLVLGLDGAEASDAKNVAYTSIPALEKGSRYSVTGFFIGYDWGWSANKFFITSVSEIKQNRIKFADGDYFETGVDLILGTDARELKYIYTVSDADSANLVGTDYPGMVSFSSSDENIVKAEKTTTEPDTAGNADLRLKLTPVAEGTAKVTAKITKPAKGSEAAKVLFEKNITINVVLPDSYAKVSSASDLKASDEVVLTFSNGGKTYALAAETYKSFYLKAVEVKLSEDGTLSSLSLNGGSVLTLEAGSEADSYYFHADNGKYLSSVKNDTHYNAVVRDSKDAGSLFKVAYNQGVLSVRNSSTGVYISGTVYNGTPEFQGDGDNSTSANYPLAFYKKK